LGSIAEHPATATATAHMSTITKPKRITQPRHPKTKESPTEEKESQARQHTQENQKTATEATQEVLESTQKLPAEPTKLSPKEWKRQHDLWLHAAMQLTLGNDTVLDLLD